MNEPDQPEVFDAAAFREDLGAPGLIADLVAMFPEETESSLDEAREALAARDAEALHTAAHALKGTIGNYAAKRAFEAVNALDDHARAGKLDAAAGLLATAERELKLLAEALERFRDTLE